MNTTKNTTILASIIGDEKNYTNQVYSELDMVVSDYLSHYRNDAKRSAAVEKIKSFYSLLGVIDPVLALSNHYLIKTSNGLDKPNGIFTFFKSSYNDNVVTFTIDTNKFSLFINKYLPSTKGHLDRQDKVIDIFFEALNQYINTNNNNHYLHYQTSKYYDKSIQEQQDGYLFETTYNFYLKEFEELFIKNKHYASSMPNYYIVERDLLDPSVPKVNKQAIADRSYFVNEARNIDNKIVSGTITPIQNYSINVDSTPSSLSPTAFPYYNTVKFTNNVQNNTFNKFLSDNKLFTLCLNNYHRNTYKPLVTSSFENVIVQSITINETVTDSSVYKNVYGQPVAYDVKNVYNNKLISSINLNNILYFNSTDQIGFGVENTGSLIVEPQQELNQIISDGASRIFDYVKALNIVDKLFENEINYNTVYKLEKLSTNTLFYLIQKYEDDILKENITIPKSVKNIDNFYIDTQINYNTNVKYVISSIDLIPKLYTQYSSVYLDNKVEVSVQLSSSYEFYSNELFTKNVIVNDTPPLVPSINFTTFKGISNKVLVNFNTTFGSLIDYPISIISSDTDKISNLYSIQNRTDGKLLYSTTDPLKSIQIFIVNDKPFSYNDYQNIQPIEVLMNSQFTKSIAFQIEPNKKYYFMFRAVDIHDLISNPSLVYELEIVQNSGAIYPILNVVNFEINKSYDTSKSFKKYLNLQPALEYTYPIKNEDGSVMLGNKTDLWDQKYKVRIISKKSGKTFDVNLSFVKDEQDFS